MAYILLLISLCLGWVQCFGQNSYYFENHKYCTDLSPYYGDINLDQIAGVWYGVEKIMHAKGEYRVEHTKECFYIDIKEIYVEPTPPTPYPPLTNSPYQNRPFGVMEQYRMRYFVMEWHENLWHDEYHVKVNTSHKGFWVTDVPDRSTDKMYRFFGGVIQVLKAANNHLVLNFCMRLPHSQLYSVVLSRYENQLSSEEVANIHNIFTMKHLSTSSTKRVCENAAAATSVTSVLLIASWYLAWRSRD